MSAENQEQDDKYTKFKSQEMIAASTSTSTRRVIFYTFFATLLTDMYASDAKVLNHLSLWSFRLHALYFELHLPSTSTLVRICHGPSFCGAHALAAMYIWTLIANPSMEFDLAPEGRAAWLVYARGVWLHFAPVLCHWVDFKFNQKVLRDAYTYKNYGKSQLFQFWASVGGYLAMGLAWEHFNGDATATYNVTFVSSETYVLVSKATEVLSCIAVFCSMIKPKLID